MNEITKVHLGRQAFTIAVDAHKELQEYLRAIKRHMGDTDEAVEEVEIRMAELLAERGISGDKVVLLKDVDYLKEQLGKPGDFGDEDDKAEPEGAEGPKRLFRDTQNAMVAGVAAGIAKYLGVDPIWIRLAFVALVFAGASGILIYIILWLIIPEAKTSSDRLKMQGRPVTVDALKDVVERADVSGAAARATHTAGAVARQIFKVLGVLIGVGLVTAGVTTLLGLLGIGTYVWLNHASVLPFAIFPVSAMDYVLLGLIAVVAVSMALLILFAGLAFIKRRWPMPGWVLATLVALFISASTIGAVIAATTAPKVVDRYNSARHSDVRQTQEFGAISIIGNPGSHRIIPIIHRVSDTYRIEFDYLGNANTKGITVDEKDGIVMINTSEYEPDPACARVCLLRDLDLRIVAYWPLGKDVTITSDGESDVMQSIPGDNGSMLEKTPTTLIFPKTD